MSNLSASLLDTCVYRSHCIRVFGHAYHPYHMATDAGTCAIILFSAWFIASQPGLTFLGFLVAFAATQVTYKLARLVRQRVWGYASRSFLQDTVLILFPSFVVASWLVGNDLPASLDLMGLDLALGLSFIRIGCFLGGCCYGRQAGWGVLYTPEFSRNVQGCRTYATGPISDGRVVPIQLFESAFNAALFGVLLVWHLRSPSSYGHVLPAYLIAYSVWRFVSDFWRAVSARPRRGGLSQAQWYALTLCALMIVVLAI